MKSRIVAFGSGLLFSIGLGVSGMTRPAKVLAFLDVAGRWDASLALVMVGAIAVGFLGIRYANKRGRPFLARQFFLPGSTRVDASLVFGSVLFGVGWGLSGYCPGPAAMSLATGRLTAFVFVASMLAGMGMFDVLFHPRSKNLLDGAFGKVSRASESAG